MSEQQDQPPQAAKDDASTDAAMSTKNPPQRNPGVWRHIVGILATAVIVGAVFLLLPISKEQTPRGVVKNVWAALQKHDLAHFKTAVDTSALIQSLMEQAITYEKALNSAKTPPIEDVRRVMSTGLMETFRDDLTTVYNTQLEALVSQGSLPQQDKGLMSQLWAETGAQRHAFQALTLIDQHDRHALVNLSFKRPDLGDDTLHLNILLEKAHQYPESGWVITGVPNLASFLLNIQKKRGQILEALNTPIRAKLQDAVEVIDVQKSVGLDQHQTGVLWRMAYMNKTSQDIAQFDLKIKLYNAQGKLLKTQIFTEMDPLLKGTTAEKAWPMALSVANSAEAQILGNDLRTLRFETQITRITFLNGDTLKVLTTLPAQQISNNEQ